MNLFNLAATLTLDNKDYEKGLKQSEKSASSFSSKLGTAMKAGAKAITAMASAVAVAGAAIVGLINKTTQFGDDIDKTSQKLGLSTEAYQKWSIAAQMAGTDVSTLQTGIRELNKFTQDLTEGTGDSLLALQELGIGYEDFMAMNNDDRLKAVVEAMQDLETGTDKTRLAQELFGQRAYMELMPLLNQEKGSLDELFATFEEGGLIIGDDAVKASAKFQDQLTLLKTTITVVGSNMVSEFLPDVSALMDGIQGLATGTEEASDQIVDAIAGIVTKVADWLPDAVTKVADIALELVKSLVVALPQLAKALVGVIEDILVKVLDYLPELVEVLLDVVMALVDAIFDMDWATIIVKLMDTIFTICFEKLPEFQMKLIDKIVELFTTKAGLQKIARIGIAIGQALVNGLATVVEHGINAMMSFLDTILGWIPGVDIPTNISIGRVDWLADYDAKLAREAEEERKAEEARKKAEAQKKNYATRAKMSSYWEGTEMARLKKNFQNNIAMTDDGQIAAIQQSTSAIVNGLASKMDLSKATINVEVKIGEEDFNAEIVKRVNSNLNAQGRKNLTTVTGY